MKNYFFNADDFGYSPEINSAIKLCFENHYIESTSLLVNMEYTQQAFEIIKREKLEERVGMHFNLTEGIPLSEEIKKMPRFCDSKGSFITSRKQRLFFLSKAEKNAVKRELEAQLKVFDQAGIKPVFIDSHNHIHEELGIFLILIQIAKRSRPLKIRKTKNIGKQSLINKTYRALINAILNFFQLSRSSYFGSLEDYQCFIASNKNPFRGNCEIMIHPILKEDLILNDFFTKKPLLHSFEELKT